MKLAAKDHEKVYATKVDPLIPLNSWADVSQPQRHLHLSQLGLHGLLWQGCVEKIKDGVFCQGLVNVPIEHHSTIGDISSPRDICFGDVQNHQNGRLPTPVSSDLQRNTQPKLRVLGDVESNHPDLWKISGQFSSHRSPGAAVLQGPSAWRHDSTKIWKWNSNLPSGKRLHSHGKEPFLLSIVYQL